MEMLPSGTRLAAATFPLTLENLHVSFAAPQWHGRRIEIWTFDGPTRRRAAEARLRAAGIAATIRSAYKPLLHHFLEESDPAGWREILIRAPEGGEAAPGRFRIETYPLADLAGAGKVRFEEGGSIRPDGMAEYALELVDHAGKVTHRTVLAPNRLRTNPFGARLLCPTGWVRAHEGDKLVLDEPLETDLEAAVSQALAVLEKGPWREQEPYFDRLNIRIAAPFEDQPLAFGHECVSMAEAVHEDLYFGALEIFAHRRGLKPGDRTIRPGQIVPDIRPGEGAVTLEIEAQGDPLLAQDRGVNPVQPALDTAERWLAPEEIAGTLAALPGTAFACTSQRGRAVMAKHVAGKGPSFIISAGQHANETSGPVGALRAARRLAGQGRDFVISPLENPDGYALLRESVTIHPHHMHHAARYTASGGDLEYMARGYENEIRHEALRRTGAMLHLSLHGYPAHEWTRPFAGYLPRGFESWCLPRGFFLILRHAPGMRAAGEAILDQVVEALSGFDALMALNARQLAAFARYGLTADFELRAGIPVMINERTDQLFPLTLITEAPDETVTGDLFRLLHEAHMRAVLAAADALTGLDLQA
ncbi:MAG: peptidase M14 [Proteobacteria bacterium]|nr:peptidase M14 [Pseudomonadota bacterium]